MRSEVGEHVAGGGEADGVSAKGGLVGEVSQEHGLAEPVGTDEHGVGALFDEAEGEEILDGVAVDFGGPGPVEIGDGFEGSDARFDESSLEAASFALVLFLLDERE